jgi:hypothetical protein
MIDRTRYRYRYSVVEAAAVGVEMHPIKDIMLWAPDATDIVSMPKAECWLFTANALSSVPPYVEVMHAPSTAAECAAASAAGLQVCPTCGDWLPREWHDFECGGHGHHYIPPDPVPLARPKHPTQVEVDREFKQASHNAVGVVVLIAVVVFVLLMLGLFGSELRP